LPARPLAGRDSSDEFQLRPASSLRKQKDFQQEFAHSRVLDAVVALELLQSITNASELADRKRKSKQAKHSGAGWSLRWMENERTRRLKLSAPPPLQLPGWKELNNALPAERMQLRAPHGSSSWYNAISLHQDWCEFQSCCGHRGNIGLLASSCVPQSQWTKHCSVSVQNMLALRIRIRESASNQRHFVTQTVQALERVVGRDSHFSARVALPDGGMVCRSCYRAVVGVSRSTIFDYRARLSLLAQCDDRLSARANATLPPQGTPADAGSAQPEAELDAVAAHISTDERGGRSSHMFNLTRALLLLYCEEHAQFDPAGDTEGTDAHVSKQILPLRSHGELLAALDALLLELLRDGVGVRGYHGPLPRLPDESSGSAHAASSGGGRRRRCVSRMEYFLSSSTLRRVLKALERSEGIRVSITQSKGVCRCDDCERLDQLRKKSPANSLARAVFVKQKREHLAVAARQRAHFNDKKAQAIAHPSQLWTITFDGFDQSKTQLPHRSRLSKYLENFKRGMIGLHVVGAFSFGAPVPICAYFNDATMSKDSNLSSTILFDLLDKQWQRLINEYLDAHKALPGDWSGVAAQATLLDAASKYAASKWPRQLHLTFDNAGGEAKNQYFFRTVGVLVHYGVFEAITLSTLLVGHTHDIVDQMFRSASTLHAHCQGGLHACAAPLAVRSAIRSRCVCPVLCGVRPVCGLSGCAFPAPTRCRG